MWLDGCHEWVQGGMLRVKDGEGEADRPEDTRRSGAGVQNHHRHREGTAATPSNDCQPTVISAERNRGWLGAGHAGP